VYRINEKNCISYYLRSCSPSVWSGSYVALRREQKKKRREGKGRGDQALVSDKKEVEINVGQYRSCMDAGVTGLKHSRNRLYL
jgi:hypothetical protein